MEPIVKTKVSPIVVVSSDWEHLDFINQKYYLKGILQLFPTKSFEHIVGPLKQVENVIEYFVIQIFDNHFRDTAFFQVFSNLGNDKISQEETTERLLPSYIRALECAASYINCKVTAFSNGVITDRCDAKTVNFGVTYDVGKASGSTACMLLDIVERHDLVAFGKLLNTCLRLELGKHFPHFETFTVNKFPDELAADESIKTDAKCIGIREVVVSCNLYVQRFPNTEQSVVLWNYQKLCSKLGLEAKDAEFSVPFSSSGNFSFELTSSLDNGGSLLRQKFRCGKIRKLYTKLTLPQISKKMSPRPSTAFTSSRSSSVSSCIERNYDKKRSRFLKKQKQLRNAIDKIYYGLLDPKTYYICKDNFDRRLQYKGFIHWVPPNSTFTIQDFVDKSWENFDKVMSPSTTLECVEWIPVSKYLSKLEKSLKPVVDTLHYYLRLLSVDRQLLTSDETRMNAQLCEAVLNLLIMGKIRIDDGYFDSKVVSYLNLKEQDIVYEQGQIPQTKCTTVFTLPEGWKLLDYFKHSSSGGILQFNKFSDLSTIPLLEDQHCKPDENEVDGNMNGKLLLDLLKQPPILGVLTEYLSVYDLRNLRLTCQSLSVKLKSVLEKKSWLRLDYNKLRSWYKNKRLENVGNNSSINGIAAEGERGMKFNNMIIRHFANMYTYKTALDVPPPVLINNACNIRVLCITSLCPAAVHAVHYLGCFMKNVVRLELVFSAPYESRSDINFYAFLESAEYSNQPCFDNLETLFIKQRVLCTGKVMIWTKYLHLDFSRLCSGFKKLTYLECDRDSIHIFDGLDEWLNKFYWKESNIVFSKLSTAIKSSKALPKLCRLENLILEVKRSFELSKGHNEDEKSALAYLEERDDKLYNGGRNLNPGGYSGLFTYSDDSDSEFSGFSSSDDD